MPDFLYFGVRGGRRNDIGNSCSLWSIIWYMFFFLSMKDIANQRQNVTFADMVFLHKNILSDSGGIYKSTQIARQMQTTNLQFSIQETSISRSWIYFAASVIISLVLAIFIYGIPALYLSRQLQIATLLFALIPRESFVWDELCSIGLIDISSVNESLCREKVFFFCYIFGFFYPCFFCCCFFFSWWIDRERLSNDYMLVWLISRFIVSKIWLMNLKLQSCEEVLISPIVQMQRKKINRVFPSIITGDPAQFWIQPSRTKNVWWVSSFLHKFGMSFFNATLRFCMLWY